MVSTGFPGDSDPRDEIPDPPCCEWCDDPMEWEGDAEYDSDTGRVVACGGSFSCVNSSCPEKNQHVRALHNKLSNVRFALVTQKTDISEELKKKLLTILDS
jgi:hypothetical protein